MTHQPHPLRPSQRVLGRSDLSVSVVGLGCMGMSEFYGPADRAQSIDVIHHALDIGINFFDTADMYGVGHNESLLGEALRDRRELAIVATKFGNVRGADGAFLGVSGRPEYVRRACDASLQRLGIDVIDLYYQHRVDPNVPIEDTVGAMADLVKAGKVRYLGMSEAKPETLRRACAVHPITALQTEYSLWTRDPEDGLLATCADLGISFVAYSPLGRGFLSGQIRSVDDLAPNDFRRHNPRFQGENFAKNFAIVERVEGIAREKGVSPAQIALAWVLAQDPRLVTIPGTRSRARLEENAAAAAITLSTEDLRRLDEAAPKGSAAGTRYPEPAMRTLNQ